MHFNLVLLFKLLLMMAIEINAVQFNNITELRQQSRIQNSVNKTLLGGTREMSVQELEAQHDVRYKDLDGQSIILRSWIDGLYITLKENGDYITVGEKDPDVKKHIFKVSVYEDYKIALKTNNERYPRPYDDKLELLGGKAMDSSKFEIFYDADNADKVALKTSNDKFLSVSGEGEFSIKKMENDELSKNEFFTIKVLYKLLKDYIENFDPEKRECYSCFQAADFKVVKYTKTREEHECKEEDKEDIMKVKLETKTALIRPFLYILEHEMINGLYDCHKKELTLSRNEFKGKCRFSQGKSQDCLLDFNVKYLDGRLENIFVKSSVITSKHEVEYFMKLLYDETEPKYKNYYSFKTHSGINKLYFKYFSEMKVYASGNNKGIYALYKNKNSFDHVYICSSLYDEITCAVLKKLDKLKIDEKFINALRDDEEEFREDERFTDLFDAGKRLKELPIFSSDGDIYLQSSKYNTGSINLDFEGFGTFYHAIVVNEVNSEINIYDIIEGGDDFVMLRVALDEEKLVELGINTDLYKKIVLKVKLKKKSISLTTFPNIDISPQTAIKMLFRLKDEEEINEESVLEQLFNSEFKGDSLILFSLVQIVLRKDNELCIEMKHKEKFTMIADKLIITKTVLVYCQQNGILKLSSYDNNEHNFGTSMVLGLHAEKEENKYAQKYSGKIKFFDINYLQNEIGKTFSSLHYQKSFPNLLQFGLKEMQFSYTSKRNYVKFYGKATINTILFDTMVVYQYNENGYCAIGLHKEKEETKSKELETTRKVDITGNRKESQEEAKGESINKDESKKGVILVKLLQYIYGTWKFDLQSLIAFHEIDICIQNDRNTDKFINVYDDVDIRTDNELIKCRTILEKVEERFTNNVVATEDLKLAEIVIGARYHDYDCEQKDVKDNLCKFVSRTWTDTQESGTKEIPQYLGYVLPKRFRINAISKSNIELGDKIVIQSIGDDIVSHTIKADLNDKMDNDNDFTEILKNINSDTEKLDSRSNKNEEPEKKIIMKPITILSDADPNYKITLNKAKGCLVINDEMYGKCLQAELRFADDSVFLGVPDIEDDTLLACFLCIPDVNEYMIRVRQYKISSTASLEYIVFNSDLKIGSVESKTIDMKGEVGLTEQHLYANKLKNRFFICKRMSETLNLQEIFDAFGMKIATESTPLLKGIQLKKICFTFTNTPKWEITTEGIVAEKGLWLHAQSTYPSIRANGVTDEFIGDVKIKLDEEKKILIELPPIRLFQITDDDLTKRYNNLKAASISLKTFNDRYIIDADGSIITSEKKGIHGQHIFQVALLGYPKLALKTRLGKCIWNIEEQKVSVGDVPINNHEDNVEQIEKSEKCSIFTIGFDDKDVSKIVLKTISDKIITADENGKLKLSESLNRDNEKLTLEDISSGDKEFKLTVLASDNSQDNGPLLEIDLEQNEVKTSSRLSGYMKTIGFEGIVMFFFQNLGSSTLLFDRNNYDRMVLPKNFGPKPYGVKDSFFRNGYYIEGVLQKDNYYKASTFKFQYNAEKILVRINDQYNDLVTERLQIMESKTAQFLELVTIMETEISTFQDDKIDCNKIDTDYDRLSKNQKLHQRHQRNSMKRCDSECNMIYTPGFLWDKRCHLSNRMHNVTCLRFKNDALLSANMKCIANCEVNRIKAYGRSELSQRTNERIEDAIEESHKTGAPYCDLLKIQANLKLEIKEDKTEMQEFYDNVKNINENPTKVTKLVTELKDITKIDLPLKMYFGIAFDGKEVSKDKKLFRIDSALAERVANYVLERIKEDFDNYYLSLKNANIKYEEKADKIKKWKIANRDWIRHKKRNKGVAPPARKATYLEDLDYNNYATSLYSEESLRLTNVISAYTPWYVLARENPFDVQIPNNKVTRYPDTLVRSACANTRNKLAEYKDMVKYMKSWSTAYDEARATVYFLTVNIKKGLSQFTAKAYKRGGGSYKKRYMNKNNSTNHVEKKWMNKLETGFSDWENEFNKQLYSLYTWGPKMMKNEMNAIFTPDGYKDFDNFIQSSAKPLDDGYTRSMNSKDKPFKQISQYLVDGINNMKSIDDNKHVVDGIQSMIDKIERNTVRCHDEL